MPPSSQIFNNLYLIVSHGFCSARGYHGNDDKQLLAVINQSLRFDNWARVALFASDETGNVHLCPTLCNDVDAREDIRRVMDRLGNEMNKYGETLMRMRAAAQRADLERQEQEHRRREQQHQGQQQRSVLSGPNAQNGQDAQSGENGAPGQTGESGENGQAGQMGQAAQVSRDGQNGEAEQAEQAEQDAPQGQGEEPQGRRQTLRHRIRRVRWASPLSWGSRTPPPTPQDVRDQRSSQRDSQHPRENDDEEQVAASTHTSAGAGARASTTGTLDTATLQAVSEEEGALYRAIERALDELYDICPVGPLLHDDDGDVPMQDGNAVNGNASMNGDETLGGCVGNEEL
ncbi:collagen triple helix repeat protein [Aspergillus foveolatus]|uniref:collagen triple helix repeat protein n=1 Tax=Aspergillus foveolatus TaxID=210207 RepID=UPI003CCD2987